MKEGSCLFLGKKQNWQEETKTALYIGNGDEAQGIATGCIRTNGSTCEGTGSPEKKVSGQSTEKEWICIRSEWNSMAGKSERLHLRIKRERQMVADFVTGVVIGEILDGIMAAIQNKLRSIFANNDAAVCEVIERGEDVLDEIKRIDEIEVEFNYNSKLDKAEFARQLADQQKGMNAIGSQWRYRIDGVDAQIKNGREYV